MIHATRPFVLNEWIQTKIEGYEVSGTVEVCPFLLPLIVKQENREYDYDYSEHFMYMHIIFSSVNFI